MTANAPSLANNSNCNCRYRLTKVGQTLRNQRSSSSSSNSSDLQIEHDYQRELEQVLLDEERDLQLERHPRLCSPSQYYQQHRCLHQQQRDVSLDYNDELIHWCIQLVSTAPLQLPWILGQLQAEWYLPSIG